MDGSMSGRGVDRPRKSRWIERIGTGFNTARRDPSERGVPLSNLSAGYAPLGASSSTAVDTQPSYSSGPAGGHEKTAYSNAQGLASDDGLARYATRQHRPSFTRYWWRELMACAVFVGALFGLFGTLYSYTDRPSPEWPSWLSLNTIIAIYIVLLKAGILLVCAEGLGQLKWTWFSKADRPLDDLVTYDDATRGPLGATTLLWRLKSHHLLSSFGALIIILCLATDPFAQQIIRYYDCSIAVANATTTPSIPRTNYYLQPQGVHTGAGLQTLNKNIMKSILEGIFAPVGPPDPYCTTGNCTWANEFSTVAWSSSYTLGPFWNYTTSLPDGGIRIGMAPQLDGGMVDYAAMAQTPYNVTEKILAKQGSGASPPVMLDFVLAKDIQYVYGGSDKFKPLDPATSGGTFEGCNSAINASTWPCQGYGAARCKIYPSVQTFRAAVNAGHVTQTLVHEATEWGFVQGMSAAGMLDTSCLTPADFTELKLKKYNVTTTSRWQPFNMPTGDSVDAYAEQLAFVRKLLSTGCLYLMDGTFTNSLAGYLDSILTGTVSGPQLFVYGSEVGMFTGPQAIQTVFNFGNVTIDSVSGLFVNMTTSLTNYIRYNGYNYTTPAYGVAHETKTCIAVRWPFLAFPAILALLTLIFFILMLRETRHLNHDWKSSPLPLLYRGLGSKGSEASLEPQTHPPVVEDLDKMKRMARQTFVKLDRSSTGVAQFEISRPRSQMTM